MIYTFSKEFGNGYGCKQSQRAVFVQPSHKINSSFSSSEKSLPFCKIKASFLLGLSLRTASHWNVMVKNISIPLNLSLISLP